MVRIAAATGAGVLWIAKSAAGAARFQRLPQRSYKDPRRKAGGLSGEWIIIRGQTEPGKAPSSMQSCISSKRAGTNELAGKPIKKVKKLAERVAFVFQNPEYQFVANTVYEEMAYSLRMDGKRNPEIEKACGGISGALPVGRTAR